MYVYIYMCISYVCVQTIQRLVGNKRVLHVFSQILVLTMVGIGLLFSIVFHIGTKEEGDNSTQMEDQTSMTHTDVMKWRDWFREHQFYLVRYKFESYCFAEN